MATPQSIVYGTWTRAYAPLAIASLAGFGLGQPWDFAAVAAAHGGLAFVLAWLGCLLVLALPLRMLELMLGKRARRGLIEGMSHLTREADAPRFWRSAAWGALTAAAVSLVILVVVTGWSLAFVGHRLASSDIYSAANAGPAWLGGIVVVALIAAALERLGLQKLQVFYFVLWVLVAGLLLAAALPGVNAGGNALLAWHGSDLNWMGWAEAARFALLSLAGGLGVLMIVGAYIPQNSSVTTLALPALLLQALLTLLAGLALAPVVPVAATLPGNSMLFEQLPAALTSQGSLAMLVFGAAALAGLVAVVALGEVIQRVLTEKGLGALVALGVVFGGVLLVAGGLCLSGHTGVDAGLMPALRGWLLLVLLGFSLFGGWAMKISHARKELNLPSELIYNLWRIAVRILCPLAIVLALAGGLH